MFLPPQVKPIEPSGPVLLPPQPRPIEFVPSGLPAQPRPIEPVGLPPTIPKPTGSGVAVAPVHPPKPDFKQLDYKLPDYRLPESRLPDFRPPVGLRPGQPSEEVTSVGNAGVNNEQFIR